MRPTLLIGACAIPIAIASMPASAAEPLPAGLESARHAIEVSAVKRKKRASGHQAYGQGNQIACTFLGCAPIPRGCRIQTGRNPFTWEPTGFDEVVCPYRR